VTVFEQTGFDARLEWGLEGARVLAGACRVVVVVDVLRRPDGALRPAVEDLLGAGAVLHALDGRPSPEARAAVAAFRQHDLPHDLLACASGRELAALGRAAEVHLAAEHDVSQVVPVLRDGAFTADPSGQG
jgi:2-phosphosulfolactate phosphatase